MRGFRTAGVALLAALAASALAAPGARALGVTQPEWYECVKLKGGAFEKGCGSTGGKGGYEARPGLGGSSSFAAKGASVVLQAVNGHSVTCKVFTEEGTRAMPNKVENLTIHMSSCARTGTHQMCYAREEEAIHEKSFVIESFTLSGELGYISRSPLRVGLKLTPQAEPGGLIFEKIVCPDSNFDERWGGSVVAEITGVVNVSSKKAALDYALGPYLGEVSPGYTPQTDPPLEGEAAGGLIEESKANNPPKDPWGNPLPAGWSGKMKIPGTLMVRA